MNAINRCTLLVCLLLSSFSLIGQLVEGVDFEVGVLDLNEAVAPAYPIESYLTTEEGILAFFRGQFPHFLNALVYFNGDSAKVLLSERGTTFELLESFNGGVLVKEDPFSADAKYFFLHLSTGERSDLDIDLFRLNRPHYIPSTGLFTFTDDQERLRATNGTDGIVRTLLSNIGIASFDEPYKFQGKTVLVNNGDLWITDGTSAGTISLTNDRLSGPPDDLFPGKDFILFEFGDQLFASRGTRQTTIAITDERFFTNFSDFNFTQLDNGVVFSGETFEGGKELWFTDGTREGTVLLREFVDGQMDGIGRSANWLPLSNYLFFEALDENGLETFWTTDGTAEGTHQILIPGVSPEDLASSSGDDRIVASEDGDNYIFLRNRTIDKSYLLGNNPSFPNQPFLLIDSFPGRFYSSISVSLGENVLFYDESTRDGLYSISGPDHAPVKVGGFERLEEDLPLAHNGIAYFKAELKNDTIGIGNEFFRSDGTAQGTFPLLDAVEGPTSSVGSAFFVLEDTVHIYAQNDHNFESIYTTDGTLEGTRLKTDLFQHTADADVSRLWAAGKKLIINNFDMLYTSNGDRSTTEFLLSGNEFQSIIDLNNGSFFIADENDDLIRVRLNEGPVVPEAVFPGIANDFAFESQAFEGDLFAHKIDYSPTPRTQLVLKLNTNTGLIDTISNLGFQGTPRNGAPEIITGGGALYFFSQNPSTPTIELWKSDGSAQGTEMVATLFTESDPIYRGLTAAGGALYVFENQFDTSIKKISFDGEATDIELNETGFNVKNFLDFGAVAVVETFRNFYSIQPDGSSIPLFSTDPEFTHRLSPSQMMVGLINDNRGECWITGGTPETTRKLFTFPEGSFDGGVTRVAHYGDLSVITARINTFERLFIFDHGTENLQQLAWPYSTVANFENPVFSQGKFYFIADNFISGEEIHYLDFNLKKSTTGLTYHDANQNNQPDPEEASLVNIPVIAQGASSRTTFSNQEGRFSHYLRPEESYTISVLPDPCWELTTTPESYPITTNRDGIDTLNFGFQPLQGAASIRPLLSMARPRCGFTVPAWLTLFNDGCKDLEYTSASITLPEGVTLISVDSPPTVAGNTLSWEPGALPTGESHVIYLELQMPGEEANGEDITINIRSTGTYNFDMAIDAEFLFNQPLSCAIDPNDKQVTPARPEPSNSNYTQNDETLTYTIRFQNTGTDTAFNVRLEDQLSNQLDHLTFKPITASHDYRASMDENGLVKVFFDNIMLPDSNVNQTLSNGFFTFDVNARSGLEDFTTIDNTVGIFFDFNQPVITNTVTNTVVEFLDEDQDGFFFYEECDDENPDINPDRYDIPGNGIDENCDDADTPVSTTSPLSGQLSIFPNPTHQQINLTFSDNRELVAQLYDLIGREHTQLVFRRSGRLSLDHLPAGTYLLKVTDALKGETNIQRVIRR